MEQSQEQPQETTLKKEHSYTYWVKPTNPDVKINTAPVKIDKPIEEATKLENKGLGPSLWNSSGTWEERKVPTKDFEDRLKAAFKNYKTTDGKASVEQVTASGEISLYYSRGKKGVAYEIKVVLSYKGTEGFSDASGDFTFTQLTDHGDCESTISSKGEASKQAVKQSVIADRQKYFKVIQAELNRYKE